MAQQSNLEDLSGAGGTAEPIWLVQVQSHPDCVEKILDNIMTVDPLAYGKYERNAFVSAVGAETFRPQEGSATVLHMDPTAQMRTTPCVQVVISIPQEVERLSKVLAAIREVHHYEEPVIFITGAWASRAHYNPNNDNPNRWWNQAPI